MSPFEGIGIVKLNVIKDGKSIAEPTGMLRYLAILIIASPVLALPALSGDFKSGDNAFARGDYARALREWKMVAKKGNAAAQFNLGLMYEKGLGVNLENKEAARWYLKAAEQGHAKAQNNLGAMYAVGLGVLKDHRRAHMWWNISALNGIKSAAENKMRIERMMSSDQVDKAKQMARECVLKKKLIGC